MRDENIAGLLFLKRNVLRLDLKESRERVSFGEEGEGHSMQTIYNHNAK